MALSAGTKLGPYEVVAPIGAGGMGEVYKARDPRIGREVAIKVLPPALAADPDRLRRFEQEVQAAGALNHPNILAIYDVGTQDGLPYIVSELLIGETLRERLRDGPIAPRKAIEYALAVAHGLAAAHEKGIVHRDLKPENLFVTKDERVKILDFGLAKLTQPEPADTEATLAAATEPGAVLGTAGYMSPEQVRGESSDSRSDIFSFGTILYEMLAGKRAFQRTSAAETMTAILRDEPPEISDLERSLPPALERVVRHCLEKKADLRFQSARDMAFALEALSGLSGRGTAAPVAAGAMQAAAKRRRWPLAAGIAVAAAAVAAAFFAGERIVTRPFPSFHQLTFRQGYIASARFAPDGQTVIYGAAWDGAPVQIYSTRPEGPESRPLGLDADVLSISKSGEMAVSLGRKYRGHMSIGTLGRMLLAGAAPREILDAVQEADWGPDEQVALVRRMEGKHRLEYPSGKVLYQTEGWLSHVRFARDGSRIAFVDHPLYQDDRGSVAVTDRAGNKRTLTGDWPSVQGLAWSPTGREIWFTASEAGTNRALWAVPASGGNVRLVYRMAGTLTLHDIYADGRVLMSQDKMQLRVRAKASGDSQERDVTWFDWSFARDLSTDGKTVVINEQGEGGGPRYTIYMRKTDGSPGVRIGEGSAQGLSPDGKFVLAILIHTSPNQLILLPTGAGEGRSLSYGSLNYKFAEWFPDGKRILVSANEPGKDAFLYVQDLAGGKPREVVGEAALFPAISPDGRWIAFLDAHERTAVCPAEGGAPREIAGVEPGERPINWSSDNKSLWVFKPGNTPGQVYQVDVSTGKRELWRELQSNDPAGTRGVGRVLITPDGKSYAYHYSRFLSELFLVEGLK